MFCIDTLLYFTSNKKRVNTCFVFVKINNTYLAIYLFGWCRLDQCLENLSHLKSLFKYRFWAPPPDYLIWGGYICISNKLSGVTDSVMSWL